MSPQEWLASQKGSAAPVKAMSPEEWLAAQRQREGRPPVVEEESVFRQVADVPVGIARSFVGGLENVANTYRPDSDAAKSLRGAKEYLGALMSATAKKDEKEQARILKEVEDKGAMDQVQGALKALAVAPVDTVASAVGSLGVQAIGALTGFLLGGPPGALIGSRVVGGAMGAGGTKGAIYSEVKKALKENGVPEDRAEKLAIEAQEYGGKNLDMIALSGGLGIFAGGTGAEKDLIKKIVSRTVAKEAAESAAKQAVTEVPKTGAKAAAKTVIKSAGAEGVPEVLQAAQEKAAENIALQRTGEELGIKALAETPTMRGVFAAGTMEGIAGAVVGGGLSLRQAVRIARDSGASDEQIKQLQDRIDAEQAKKELQIQAAAVSPEAVAGRASELVGEAPSAADVLTAAQQAVSEKLDEPPAAPETPAQKVAEASAEVDAMTSRVDELTDEYIAAGEAPDQAKIKAAAQAAEEEQNDQAVEQSQAELAKVQAEAAKRAEDVAKTIEQGGGASVPIPSEPEAGVPTEGVEPPVAPSVERPALAPEPTVRGEEVPPSAVELDPLLDQAKNIVITTQRASPSLIQRMLEVPFNRAQRILEQLETEGVVSARGSNSVRTVLAEKPPALETPTTPVETTKGTPTPTPIIQPETLLPGHPDYASEVIEPAKQAIQDNNFKPITLKNGTTVNLVVSQNNDNSAGRVIAFTKNGAEVGHLIFAKLELDPGLGHNPYVGVEKDFQRQGLATAMYDLAEASGAKIPAFEQEGELRSKEGQAFRKARAQVTLKSKETPSVTTPPEAKQAKEEGTAAPAEGTEVAKPATEIKPITVLKQPSSKNAAGESVKSLELSNGETVQITRRGKQWVREDAGKVTPVGKTLKEAIANITEAKPEPKTEQQEPEVLKQTQESTTSRINDAVNNLRNKEGATARDAARAVINNTRENSFENVLAKRLLNLVGDVPFNVIDADHKDAKVRDKFIREDAKGVYVRDSDILGNPLPKGSVYVVGAKYGNLKQGVNNRTVLHELTHVGSAERIKQGKAILAENKNSMDPRAVAVRKLQALMEATQREYARLESNPDLPTAEQLEILSSDRFQNMMGKKKGQGKALYDLDEFFTYAMTDPQFQTFLKTVKFGPTQTAFSKFVSVLRNLLGLNKDTESVLANIVDVSETLLPTTEAADTALQKGDLASALKELELLSQKQDVQTAADVQVKYANDVIKTPRSQGPSVSAFSQAVANRMDISSQAELAGAIAEGAMSGARKHILGAFTPSQLAKLVKDKVPALTRVVDLGRKFNAKRQQYLDEMKKTMKPWLKLQRNDREQSQLLATLMHLATVNGIDPSIPANKRVASTPQSDTLDDLWEKLGEPAREIYIDVRDYYAKQYDRYKDLLEKRIQAMGISDEEKIKFMDLLKKEFEVGKVAQPYFPLMRYGENWLRVGKGKDMEFYMFESASERNRFAIRRAKEMGKPLKDLYADGTLKRGDQLKNMMEESFADTTKLKEVLAAVDKLGIDTDKASIKDEIYQMYLLTLPEKSFRKQFIHRKNTAGFSADALRNFGTAGFRMSNQLAKMEYQPQIVNTLDEARESIKDDPDASKYRTYIEEVAGDFDAAVNPKNENSILNFAANGLSTLNFFYYMSSISSALTNMTSLPVFGYPTLLAEYGKTPGGAKDVHKELVRFMNVYKEVGFRRKVNGKTEYVMPSLRNALTNADEIKAYDEFAADNLFSFNRSMDLLNIVKSPSQQATNPNILKVPVQKATDFVSTIFSMTEQLPREMMAMAAYRLGRSQGLSHDEATKKALVLTHDAMYDYSMFDTPRYFRGPVGRTIFQFKKFSQNTAFYLTTNFLQIFKGADPTIRKQAATRFFGTLGMTGMFAGLTGMPLYTVMSTVAEKVLSAFGDDDDDEDSAIFQIRKYGYDLWFKKWLSENFGANVATYVAMGPVTGLTGADFNSRVKLNDLFFQDWEFKGLLGPSFGMFENAQRAYDRFKEGQTERAIETMMPAFIRQPLKAYRFSEEGVKTPKGYEVVAKEDLDWMDIAMQGIGYAPIKVSMKQSENYKLKKLEQEREEERTELLKRSVYARRGISDEDPDDIQEDIDKFNSKFPNRRILPSTIMQSDQARRRQERAVDQGLYIANPMNRRELLELRAKE